METYETLMNELTSLNIQKQAIMMSIHEIEEQLDAIKKEKAHALFNEISERISELKNLDYHFEVEVFDSDCGSYDWMDISGHYFRYRKTGEVIVD